MKPSDNFSLDVGSSIISQGTEVDSKTKSMINELLNQPEMLLATAYLYAKTFAEYGEDVTKAWTTAVQQSAILEKAYIKGVADGEKEFHDKLQKAEDDISRLTSKVNELQGELENARHRQHLGMDAFSW